MLGDIRAQGNYRSVRYVRPLCAATVIHGGKEYLNLCSNSYLSLHLHPAMMAAADATTAGAEAAPETADTEAATANE